MKKIHRKSNVYSINYLNQIPVFLSLLPCFMQYLCSTKLNHNNTINKKKELEMFQAGLSTYSYLSNVDPQMVKELTQIRDQYLGQLISQLSFNRILLDKTISLNFPFDSECSAVPTKIEDQTSEAEPLDEDELEDESKVKHISKNKVSHNSSLRNDTKNIPKNYGKAILSFIQKSPKTKKLANSLGVSHSDLMTQVRRVKKRINSIQGLKRMWGYENLDHKIKKCIRILSYEFLRKHCLPYIFHSKVKNYKTNIKYRQKLIEGVENPASFSNIKDY